MEHHYARTTGADMAVGNAVSIRSGALRPGDLLDIHLRAHAGFDHPLQAEIAEITISSMRMRMKDRVFQCRPWRMGDAGVDRLPGTVSNWTIEREDSDITVA